MFHEWRDEPFSTHTVTYEEALPLRGPLSPEIVETIRKQLQGDPARWKREMLCEWTEDTDVWLTTSLITLAQDNSIDYVDLDNELRGDLYVGADFGKKRDYGVVAVTEVSGSHKYLRHLQRFPLQTPYGAVIGYMKRVQDAWSTVRAIYADKTGVGDYIVEGMMRGGLLNVTGVNFTDTSKEAMATALKENMRRADCPVCGWSGYIEDIDGEWRTTCPEGCRRGDGRPVGLRPLLHIPYDPGLFSELNVERYELSKSGKILFNHPEGTHDDRFWALALSVYAVEMEPPPAPKPIGKTI